MSIVGQLNTLEAAGLVRLAQVQPELEYLFRHALVQEAAYSSLLKQDRRRLHLAVGEALERLYADRLTEIVGTLAHHFAAAGERERGVTYARQAAKQALDLYAYEEALQYLNTALDLTRGAESSEIRLAVLEEVGDVLRLMHEGTRAIAAYRESLDAWGGIPEADKMTSVRLQRKLIEALADTKWATEREGFLEAAQANVASWTGLETTARLMEEEAPHEETARLLIALSIAAWRIQAPSDWEAARRYAEAAVEMSEKLGNPVVLSAALETLANAQFAHGELRLHLETALRRLALTQDAGFGDLRERIDALRGAGSALMYVGEYERAITYLKEGEGLATQIQAVDQQFNALGLQAQCWFRLDRWNEVLALEEKWRDLEKRFSRERTGPTCFSLAIGAAVRALHGDFENSRQLRQESFDQMRIIAGAPEQWPLQNAHY